MTAIITDATALAWFDQFRVIADDRLCPEMTLIFADWLEDVHELTSWAECLRWMVAEEKFPYDHNPKRWYWLDSIEGSSRPPRHILPESMISSIGRDEGFIGCTIDFDTLQAAILAVMKVWHLRDDK